MSTNMNDLFKHNNNNNIHVYFVCLLAWQQHDVQELCRVMFDALEINFKNTEQVSGIQVNNQQIFPPF